MNYLTGSGSPLSLTIPSYSHPALSPSFLLSKTWSCIPLRIPSKPCSSTPPCLRDMNIQTVYTTEFTLELIRPAGLAYPPIQPSPVEAPSSLSLSSYRRNPYPPPYPSKPCSFVPSCERDDAKQSSNRINRRCTAAQH